MKVTLHLVLVSGLTLALGSFVSCGKDSDDDDDDDDGKTTNLTYSDVSTFVTDHCAASGCHSSADSNGPGDLSTHALLKANASTSASSIRSGSMPPSTSAQRTSFDATSGGKDNLLEYLDAGAPE